MKRLLFFAVVLLFSSHPAVLPALQGGREVERERDVDRARIERDNVRYEAERYRDYQSHSVDLIRSNELDIIETPITTGPEERIRRGTLIAASSQIQSGPTGNIEAHFVLPKTQQQYKSIFGKSPSAQNVAEMKRMRKRIQTEFSSDVDDFINATNISALMGNSQSRVFMLVGHNDNGRFQFIDGSSSTFSELLDMAGTHHKILVLVSCEAHKHIHADRIAVGTKTLVNLESSVEIAKRLTVRPSWSIDAIVYEMESAEKTVRERYIIKRVVVAGSTVVAVAILIYYDDKKDKTCKSHDHKTGPCKKEGVPSDSLAKYLALSSYSVPERQRDFVNEWAERWHIMDIWLTIFFLFALYMYLGPLIMAISGKSNKILLVGLINLSWGGHALAGLLHFS